jgi:hypothetical protein
VLRLTGSDRSGSYGVERVPIVGWETTTPAEWEMTAPDERDDGHCLGWPVIENSWSGSMWVPVLSPDGRVRIPGGVILDSEDEWLKHAADKRVTSLKEYARAS